jgi:hypothetical protein
MSKANKAEIVRKILAKASDRATTPEEAATLMEAARKIADKHGISLEDLKAGNVAADEFGDQLYFGGVSCLHPVVSLLGVPVMDYCGIKGYRRQREDGHYIVLFGHEADIELARYLLDLFRNTMDEGWTIYRKYSMSGNLSVDQIKSHRQSFVRGFCATLSQRLKAHTAEIIETTGTELIVLKNALVENKYMDYIKRNGLNLGETNARRHVRPNAEAAAAGAAHAKSVNMGRGVAEGGYIAIGK